MVGGNCSPVSTGPELFLQETSTFHVRHLSYLYFANSWMCVTCQVVFNRLPNVANISLFCFAKGKKKSSPSYDLLSSHTRFASLFYLYSIVVLCWVGPFFCLFCKIAGWIFYVVFHSKFAVYTRISEIMSCEEPAIFANLVYMAHNLLYLIYLKYICT